MYPVMLKIEGQRCLVVGGGGVAMRKVDGLLVDGAEVTVVATQPIRSLQRLAEEGRISLEVRPYQPGEAATYFLVFAATDDRDVNRRVFEDADSANAWVNVADDPEICNFHLPARVRRGPFQLTVASAGEAPFVVRRIRQFLERKFGEEWAQWMDAAARFRRSVLDMDITAAEREKRFDRFFAATVDTDAVKARVPTEEEETRWLSMDTPCRARAAVPVAHDAPTRTNGKKGLVSLVGSGPGDPGLLTLRARHRLMRADVVVYDRLAKTAIPCDLPATVQLQSVGKEAGHHPMPQEEITALIVRLSREGKRVVRLKGGDPYVFGRGGEEAQTLVAAGIPFEVVPCVTAGIGVPNYAGIPVTQRSEAVRLTLVTAHESIKTQGPQVRWDLLALDPHATIVGYMGTSNLPTVAKKLLGAGMSPKTPAALIERGTTAAQRSVISTIERLPTVAKEKGIRPPALFVIGPTVSLSERLDWFTTRPLFGERIGIFAPAGELGEALELAGVEVVETPLPISPAARVVIGAAPLTGWILRDADGADGLEEERESPGWGADMVAWCLSSAAERRASSLGWQNTVLVESGEPDGLVQAIQDRRSQ